MDWISDNLQIVFLVLLGLGSMLKSMFDAKAKQNAEREASGDPDDEVPLDDDTSYRKTMPTGPPPEFPPPLERRVTPPPLRMAGYDAEAANESAKALKHQQDLAARLRQIRDTKATTVGGASDTRTRVAQKGNTKPLTPVSSSLRNRLRKPGEVRQAVVMREILGPPVGLR